MASSLVEIMRHNNWANRRLLERCAELSEARLDLSAPGTYGKVRDTLVHLVGAEQRYVAALEGRDWPPPLEREAFPGFPALARISNESGDALERVAAADPIGQTLHLNRRGETWEMDPAHFLIQAIDHATEHRGHVVSILTQNGVEMPGLDGWAYSMEKGLIRQKPGGQESPS